MKTTISALLASAIAFPVFAASPDAARRIDEVIAEGCMDGGTVGPDGYWEGDLTGDGHDDLVVSHGGLQCNGQAMSMFCGAQACTIYIYVRRDAKLELVMEGLGIGFEVVEGEGLPVIRTAAHGGNPVTLRWNGTGFD